jgi:hypothetical protein
MAKTRAIIALASEYGRYGYRRITKLLQDAGWRVGSDRVQRIWRRERLNPTRHIELAGILELQGDLTGAAKCCRNAIALVPENVGYHRHLEHIEKIEERLKQSTDQYSIALAGAEERVTGPPRIYFTNFATENLADNQRFINKTAVALAGVDFEN